MKIALDAMGGDFAPEAMVQGAFDFCRDHPQHTAVLVGVQADIEKAIVVMRLPRPANLEIVHASQVVGMAEKITAIDANPDDSMNVATRLVKSGGADATVLCGNTGCSVYAAQKNIRRIPGVKRAGILTPFPHLTGTTWVCDCGANSVCRPEHLAQFGEMTVSFLQSMEGIDHPKVGVLSIGEEDGKGDELTNETLSLLKTQEHLNLIGNVEGNDIFKGTVDVVVCDGFTGNTVLKACEGAVSAVGKMLREEINRSWRRKIGALIMRPALDGLKDRTSWAKVGGCLLLGVNGITIIGHGRSKRDAVYWAMKRAMRCVEQDVIGRLTVHFKQRPATQAISSNPS